MVAEHVPVLLPEVVEGLEIRPAGCYIDGTVGAAGHARAILKASAPDGKLLGLDADPEAIAYAGEVLRESTERVTLQVASFRNLKAVATELGFDAVDGVLLDLGLSSRQLADDRRGFAFSLGGPLDMRFDQSAGRTAADIVNTLSEADLADLIWRYGEERYSRRIARSMVSRRPIDTTDELVDAISRAVPRGGGIHPATRTFMALRIAVNDELEALDQALPQATELLRPGGRLAIISFHSLEDRLVKQFIQREAKDCLCPPRVPICTCRHRATLRAITRKPIRPTASELDENPRSRSAKLRIAERL